MTDAPFNVEGIRNRFRWWRHCWRPLVPARVKEVYQSEEYCNVQLETALPMFPGNSKSGMTLNAKQVVKHTAFPSCGALDRAFENA